MNYMYIKHINLSIVKKVDVRFCRTTGRVVFAMQTNKR